MTLHRSNAARAIVNLNDANDFSRDVGDTIWPRFYVLGSEMDGLNLRNTHLFDVCFNTSARLGAVSTRPVPISERASASTHRHVSWAKAFRKKSSLPKLPDFSAM